LTELPAVSLHGVSKKYHLYDSLSHRIYEALHPFKKKFHREFWALRDVTLEIPRGATVGILGVNGSGKSTLLQLICSILQPTSGTIEVRGKVAALIELGAGFNPDLTGRENVEVNCAILGLESRAIRQRLPQIESFADIGEFFDQPVKTYSSGMFMRVAFATAISVDPDILVIDEALSVGDARFQEKCFRKFRDFQSAGKTILLVTHDRSAVPRLCSHGVLFHKGRVVLSGAPKEVTDRYSFLLTHGDSIAPPAAHPVHEVRAQSAEGQPASVMVDSAQDAVRTFLANTALADRCPLNPTFNNSEFSYGLGGARIVDFLLVGEGNVNPGEIQSGTSFEIYLRIWFERAVEDPLVGFSVKTREGALIYSVHSGWMDRPLAAARAGDIRSYKFAVKMALGTGDWFLDLAVAASATEILHTREAMIHLRTASPAQYSGLIALDTSLAEV
jgi:ABC-type polysaccharide/polyol phosphate transport system ATPase subunit